MGRLLNLELECIRLLFGKTLAVRVLAEGENILSDKSYLEDLPTCTASRRTFLRISIEEVPHLIEAFGFDADLLVMPHYVRKNACRLTADSIEAFRSISFDFDFRNGERGTVEDFVEAIVRRGYPPPTVVVDTGGGFQVHYKIARLSLLPVPSRRSKQIAMYEQAQRAFVEEFLDLGADPSAVGVAKLFRLPGSWSTKHSCQVRVVYKSPSPKAVQLSEFIEVSRKSAKDMAVPYQVQRRHNSCKLNGTVNKVMETKALQSLEDAVIPEGHRNSAVWVLANALLWDGRSPEETYEKVCSWARDHTEPLYPETEIRATVHSLARRHYEPNSPPWFVFQKLTSIRDINGRQVISNPDAKALVNLNGRQYWTHVRKKLEERKNKPFFERYVVVLEAIIEGKVNGPLSDLKVARTLAIPVRTYKEIKRNLVKAGFVYTRPRKVSFYRKTPRAGLTKREVLITLIGSLHQRGLREAKRHWPDLHRRFIQVINRICSGQTKAFCSQVHREVSQDTKPNSKANHRTSWYTGLDPP